MTSRVPLVFIGGSTGFQEIMEIVRRINRVKEQYDVVGVLDDNSALWGTKIENVPVIGGLDKVGEFPDAKFVYAIGSYKTRLNRLTIFKKLGLSENRFESLIDPSAIIFPDVSIGAGSIIHAGAVVGHKTMIGPFVILTFQVAIGPFCIIDKGAMITTKATVLTGSHVGSCAFLGAHSCVGEGVTIGAGSLITMASIISRDIAAGSVVIGSPARTLYRVELPEDMLA